MRPMHSPPQPPPPPPPPPLPISGSGISNGNGGGGGNSSGHGAKPALPPQLAPTTISSTPPFHQPYQHHCQHPPPHQAQLKSQPPTSRLQCPPRGHTSTMTGNIQGGSRLYQHSHDDHDEHNSRSSHPPGTCTVADICQRLRLAQMPRSDWTLSDLMCGLPSGWSRGSYDTPTPFPVSLRLQLLASRWFYYPVVVDAGQDGGGGGGREDGGDGQGEVGEAVEPYAHGVVRLRFRDHWLYFYDSPREAIFYLLGLDPGYVAVSLRLLTENWAHRLRMRALPRDAVLSRVWTWIMRFDRYG